MSDEVWTIGRLLNWTADFLRGKGAESPRLDAEVLLAHARGCQRIELYTAFDEVAPDALRESFRGLVKRRAEGTPVAYLVGKREFFSLSLAVTPDVLIPRPETELIVVRALDLLKAEPTLSPLVDVGTGSGALAVAIAKHAPTLRVTALDVSRAALAVAGGNAKTHGVAARISLAESDLFSALPVAEQFGIVVSNPPYVTTAELATLPVDVGKHEPRLALDGGADGTAVIARLIPQAAERLRAGGWLLMEIGPAVAERVASLLDAEPRLERRPVIKDAAGLPRVASARRRSSP